MRRLDATLSRFLFDKTRPAFGLARLCVIATAVACSALLVATGASHQVEASPDTIAALDLGWQVFTGARPHLDFFAGLGSLHPALLGLAMRLFGPTANVLAYLPACLVPIVAAAAWRLSRRRLPASQAALYSIMTPLVAAGTFWLGAGLRSQSYAMQYNRFGWVALLILGLYSVIDPDVDQPSKHEWIDDVIAGSALGLMLFHKVNYAIVATVLTLIGLALRGRRTSALAFIAGLLLASFPMVVFLRFQIGAVLADASHVLFVAQTIGSSHAPAVLRIVRRSVAQEILSLIALAIAVAAYLKTSDRLGATRVIFVTGTLVVGGVVACRGNQQLGDIPMFALAALVIGEMLRRKFGQDSRVLTATIIGVVIALPSPLRDFGSVVYSAAWHFTGASHQPVAQILGAPMRPLLFPSQPGERTDQVASRILADSSKEFLTPFQFASWVNDGVVLLRPLAPATPRVLTLDNINPYPFALGWPEPRKNVFFWNSMGWSERYPVPADTILANTDVVMIPKRPVGVASQRRFLRDAFGSAIATRFVLRRESQLWLLMVRRGSAADTVAAR